MHDSTAVTVTEKHTPAGNKYEPHDTIDHTECEVGSIGLRLAVWTEVESDGEPVDYTDPWVSEGVEAQFLPPMFDDLADDVEYRVTTFEAKPEENYGQEEHWATVGVSQRRYPGEHGAVREVIRESVVFIPAQDLVTLRNALSKEIRSARRKGLIS